MFDAGDISLAELVYSGEDILLLGWYAGGLL
jgi:hypothetical protein